MSFDKKRALEDLRLIKKRSVRFNELSKYINSYGFFLQINAGLENDKPWLHVDLEYDLVCENNLNVRSIFKNFIAAYLVGRFDEDITPLMLIADDNAVTAFPFSEIASILTVFFLRKRIAYGFSLGCLQHKLPRYVAFASTFMNSSHVMRAELIEIKLNTDPTSKLSKFFEFISWEKPPLDISINGILHAFGHLAFLPLYWFYVYHIFAKSDSSESVLKQQSISVFNNYYRLDRSLRCPSKTLAYVVDQFMSDVYAKSSDLRQTKSFNVQDVSPATAGGAHFFYKGRYYSYTVFGSWLNYCADQSITPRPDVRSRLIAHPRYQQSLPLQEYLTNQRELNYKRIVALHIKDGSYKGHKQITRLVPKECYEALFESHKDTLFIVVGETQSESLFPKQFHNVLSLSSLCNQYSCDPDCLQFFCLGWVDGYITSASGNSPLAELFNIPSLLLGGIDALSYSSFMTRMPSRVALKDGTPLTNSFFRDNLSFAEYQFGTEYNCLPDSFSVEFLSPIDVLRAYSHYISNLDIWREQTAHRPCDVGPFAIPPSPLYDSDPLRLHQASLSNALNRIDPWKHLLS